MLIVKHLSPLVVSTRCLHSLFALSNQNYHQKIIRIGCVQLHSQTGDSASRGGRGGCYMQKGVSIKDDDDDDDDDG